MFRDRGPALGEVQYRDRPLSRDERFGVAIGEAEHHPDTAHVPVQSKPGEVDGAEDLHADHVTTTSLHAAKLSTYRRKTSTITMVETLICVGAREYGSTIISIAPHSPM